MAMAIQQESDGDCGSYIGMWDPTVQPYYDAMDDSWTFEFANGEVSGACTTNGRTFIATWFCDSTKITRFVFFSFFSSPPRPPLFF